MAAPMRSSLLRFKTTIFNGNLLENSINRLQRSPGCLAYYRGQHRQYCLNESRPVDIKAAKMTFTFDTHVLVKRFQGCGFTEQQSEELVRGLTQISQEGLDHTGRNMVTKAQQEIMVQQIHAHLSALKKDMIILEKSEFSQLRHEYEKQNIELRQLRKQLDDDIMKLKAGVTLDLNLEKSRSVESHQDSLREIQQLMNKLEIQKSETGRNLAGLDNQISREVSNLIATYERYRNDVMKYAAGTVLSCLTISLGFYRIWKP